METTAPEKPCEGGPGTGQATGTGLTNPVYPSSHGRDMPDSETGSHGHQTAFPHPSLVSPPPTLEQESPAKSAGPRMHEEDPAWDPPLAGPQDKICIGVSRTEWESIRLRGLRGDEVEGGGSQLHFPESVDTSQAEVIIQVDQKKMSGA